MTYKKLIEDAQLDTTQFNRLFGYPSVHREQFKALTDAEFIQKRIDEDIDWEQLAKSVTVEDFKKDIGHVKEFAFCTCSENPCVCKKTTDVTDKT